MKQNSADIFQLIGIINVSQAGDCILIPVYSCYPRNEWFVARTDQSMNITGFQELDIFLELVRSTPTEECTKTQFAVGDVSPVLFKSDNDVVIIQGEDFDELISKLQTCNKRNTEIVSDIIRDLRGPGARPERRQYYEDLKWADLKHAEIDPKAARLWLDVAVEDLHESYGKSESVEDARVRSRILLLSWAAKIANRATTPIFRHFVEVAKRIERRGVYVQDILGLAIVSWVYQDVSRLDWLVDLIRDFRKSYGRGPLTTVLELAGHGVPELAAWANRTLGHYHDHIRRIIDGAQPYELLAMTFVADDGSHWPSDLRIKLTKNLEDHESKLNRLLDERRDVLSKLDLGIRPNEAIYDRTALYRRLRALELSIRHTTSILDSVNKALSSSIEHHDYRGRFDGIDYADLGLSHDFFASLDRATTY